jgi:cell wall-associated NlpC family hydrolase
VISVIGIGVVLTASGLSVPAASATAAIHQSNEGNVMADAARDALSALWARAFVRIDGSVRNEFAGVDPEVSAVADHWTLARRHVADLVAERSSASADLLDRIWRDTSEQRMVAVLAALSQVGVPYRRNAAAPDHALDCSGLTQYAWSVAGVALPHQSGGQISVTAHRSLDHAEPGDIVWYPGHVMLYLGAGDAIVHAPYSGARVEVKDASRISQIGSPL